MIRPCTNGPLSVAAIVLTSVFLSSPQDDREKLLSDAREAAKGGDAAKCKEISGKLLLKNPDSLALRFELAQIAEARKDTAVAFAHYNEIANAGERAAKLKEKLSDEDTKAAKEAGSKAKTITDVQGQALAKTLKTYADSVLKTARLAKTQKNWKFASEISRSIKDIFDNTPGVLDSKDPRELEAAKLYNEAMTKKKEDKPETDKQRAEISEAVATLAQEMIKLYDQAFATYEEVRGPWTRRRALLPVSILVSLSNDPDGNGKRAEAVWNRAFEVEPSKEVKLRLATDSARFTLVVNGKKVAGAKNTKELAEYWSEAEYTVNLFRETNLVGFYGHEIRDTGHKKGGRPEYLSRSWFLADFVLTEKDHITTDPTWQSLTKPPSGWDVSPYGCFDIFPVTPIGGIEMWDYERTKEWKGVTLAGDRVDSYIRKTFDLPAGFTFAIPSPEKGPESK